LSQQEILLLVISGVCCVLPTLGVLTLAFGQVLAAKLIGRARARRNYDLPLKRKGFYGLVKQAQKDERLRISEGKLHSRDANLHHKLSAITYRLNELENNHKDGATAFELQIANLFGRLGYTVTHKGGPNDGGIDLIIRKCGKAGIVQCKYYSPDSPVSSPDVRNLRGAMARDGYNYGLLITTSTFTHPAIEEAKNSGIRLIDATALTELERRAKEMDLE